MSSTRPMIYTKMLNPAARETLLRAIDGLNGYPHGRPEQAFLAAAGLTGQDATGLLAEIERESFIVRHDGRILAGPASGSRPVTFSREGDRRRELLTATALGREVLAEEEQARREQGR